MVYIYIWIKFGNPYFPLMNNIFKSPYAFEQNYADLRYLPKNLSQYLFYPFYWAIHPEINYVTEMENRDFRWAIAYISIFLVFIKFLFSKIKKENTIQYKEINPKIFLYIIFFITVSYIIWLNTSGILRYLNLIETLLGISAIGSIPYLFTKISNNKIYKTICVVIICFLVLSTQYMHPYYTRIRIPFSNKFLDFPNLNLPDNAIVFIGGGFPSAVFIPFQNPKAKWICLYSDIGGYNFDYPQNEAEKIKNLINDKNNKKYLIYAEDFGMPIGWEYIDIFLNTDDFECKKISQIWDVGYKLCQEK